MTEIFKKLPDLDYLLKLFEYNKIDGTLAWKELRKGRKKGKLTAQKSGYIEVCIDNNSYIAHRIIYKMCTGIDPLHKIIDHKNGIRTDNRMSNLRLATRSQNAQNRVKLAEKNTTGVHGVSFCKQTGKYKVRCIKDGKEIWGGRHNTLVKAEKAARELREKVFGEWRSSL